MSQTVHRPQSPLLRWLKLIGVAVLTFYLMLCLAVTVCQRQLLYHPQVIPAAQVDAAARAAKLDRWRNPAGQPMGTRRLSPHQPACGQILLTYGNAGSAVTCVHYADDIQSMGDFDVYILEYPGYEDRPGQPTETSLFQAADEALSQLPTNHPTYLVGESLGTGVAAYLAGTHPDRISGVVLLAPYNHLSAPAQYHYPWLPARWLLLDRFASDDHLRTYHGPLGVVVGTVDQVVPARFGKQLYDGYAGPKRLWEFPRDDHGDVFETLPAIWDGLMKLWRVNP
jgi:pimeloyl-ACP methyl ester carboxylesterase